MSTKHYLQILGGFEWLQGLVRTRLLGQDVDRRPQEGHRKDDKHQEKSQVQKQQENRRLS